MMKKLISVFLALLMVVALTACDTTPSGPADNPGVNPEETLVPSDEPVTLNWSATYLDPAVVKKYVDQYNAMQDHTTVVVSEATYGSVADYTAALALNIATGDGSYDLFSMSAADFNKYVNSGVTYCLDKWLLNNEDVKSYALDCVMRDGHVFGYPATNDVVGVYVNLDMLKNAGHTIEDIKDWDSMLECAADIAEKEGNYGLLTHLGFGGGYAEFLWYSSMWSAGADITMDLEGNVTVKNKDALAEAAIDWRELIMGPAGSTEFNNNIEYFVNGLCGMCLTGQTALAEMDEFLAGGYSFEWTFIPVPPVQEGGQSYSSMGGWFTVVNARNEHLYEAIEFMNWLYFESDYIADMCRRYYQISPLYSADEKLNDLYSTYYGWVYNYISEGQMVCKPEIAFDSKILEQLGKMLSSVVYQSTTKEEALAYVDRFIDSVDATVVD